MRPSAPRPPLDKRSGARQPAGPLDPQSMPFQCLKISLTLCLFTLAVLACCHLILGTTTGSSSPGPS